MDNVYLFVMGTKWIPPVTTKDTSGTVINSVMTPILFVIVNHSHAGNCVKGRYSWA